MYDIFSTVSVGSLTARNRIVRSATWLGLADRGGRATDALVARYRELGAGGVGVVVTGYGAVSPEGRQMPGMLGVWDDGHVDGLCRIASAVHDGGAVAGAQIVHAGGQTRSEWLDGASPVAPSFLDHPQFPEMPRKLSAEQVVEVVASFGRAARRVRDAGFDFVQLHAAHGYLINQFLSPGTNHRNDRYGGTLPHRFRFLQEVLTTVQVAAGPDFPVAVKLNGDDFVAGGLALEDAVRVAEWLSTRGVAFIEVSGGTPASGEAGPVRTGVKPGVGEAYFSDLARAVKQRVPCPVGVVGGLRSLETLEELLLSGVADLFSLSRPLVREPDLPRRWQGGDRAPAHCISCNGCFGPGTKGEGVRCVVKGSDPGVTEHRSPVTTTHGRSP